MIKLTYISLVTTLLLSCSQAQNISSDAGRNAFTIRQTSITTCGPAALATILTYFAGMPTTEQATVQAASKYVKVTAAPQPGEKTSALAFTALSLKSAAADLGLQARGYQVTSQKLYQYLQQGGTPVIAHVQKPQP